MEYVNIGGAWREVRGVWVNVGGVWKPSLGAYVNIGGVWKKEEKTFLYNYGTENFAWAQGYTLGAGSYAKNANNLYMKCNPNLDAGAHFRNWVTDVVIPLGNFNRVYFRGKATVNVHVIDWGICDAANKMTQNFTKQVRAVYDGQWDGISSIDVSGYSGNYHIKVQAYDASRRGTDCYIYQIWLQ